MFQPDFLIVGTARAGTTALYHLLAQHPQVFMSQVKEPCFLCFSENELRFKHGKFRFAVRNYTDYCSLFKKASNGQQKGEASTPYLYLFNHSIATAKQYFKDYRKIKIIIILRNPVERAFSQYSWRRRDGREPLSFESAIEKEQERKNKSYSFDYFYIDRSYYYDAVKAYKENFDRVAVFFYEDLKQNPKQLISELFDFLKIDKNIQLSLPKDFNKSYFPRFPFINRMITSENKLKFWMWNKLPVSCRYRIKRWVQSVNAKETEVQVNPDTRKLLQSKFKGDIEKLQGLLNCDLSSWLT